MAATKTPVPAAESQFTAHIAPSGLALGGATGGIRWTSWWRNGIGTLTRVTPGTSVLSIVLNCGQPHRPTQAMSRTQGTQACSVSGSVYGYWSSGVAGDSSVLMAPGPAAARSARSKKREPGCQTRRNTTTASTEHRPAMTSVSRCRLTELETKNCTMAKTPPATSVAGQTSKACFQVPPSIRTNVTTSQNGIRTETNGS